ncbi:cobalamin biosynthetic protein CobC [Caldimonas brevitalea]|uniref:threonine-phosphate decarboxylase n=1 Tax=Caldimonas brevitalea TaxID=413882 RepID=A0A0G3BRC3_9BURK|nr:cobalamin biosynthetic protein CobC [Caldimonas brevitalea]
MPHGADLARARQLYPAPAAGWLDLSTGLNPRPWPVAGELDRVAASVWRDLPDIEADVAQRFERYYGAPALPVPGSQAAIQALPRIWRRLYGTARCHVLAPGYGEHAARWSLEGHTVVACDSQALGQGEPDVIVLARPNNPTGEWFEADTLQALARCCRLLVVDETFLDADVHASVAALREPRVVVLRSLGKFFGLAGLRVGAVLACAPWLDALRAELGPWSVNGPGLHLAAAALADEDWQRDTRDWLAQQAQRLTALLAARGLVSHGTSLFRTVATPAARGLHEGLARRGIWTRLFWLDTPQPFRAVRFGLPANDAGLQRLAQALADVLDKDCESR